MSDGVNTGPSEPKEPNAAAEVDRTWNAGGAGNELGDRSDTTDAAWNPDGVGNATEDEIPVDPDVTEAAGE
jgi:hypothetical protein